MGDPISAATYSPRQRTVYRKHLLRDLEVFDAHLQEARFADESTIGLELELNLVDSDMQPALRNADVLAQLDADEFQSEIGACNIELNHPPLSVAGGGLQNLEDGITERLRTANEAARQADCQVAMIGTLPTVSTRFLKSDRWMTPENRYRALNHAVLSSRGELVLIDFTRQERYLEEFDDIAPESTCTSMQLHLQVSPHHFASAWNASQAIAAIQIAVGANSPLFAGHKLWHESRIPVFQQSIDTRTPELVEQGVRPRVWFGERWITSVFDLFEENVRYFAPLLPESRQQAGTAIMSGDSPSLHYLNLHNGTVWRWTRPIYAADAEASHLRVESRILPAGPTAVDIVADAAFYYGLVKFLATQNRPVWSRLRFSAATTNFFDAARDSLYARVTWPTLGRINVAELITEHLATQAREGLRMLQVDDEVADKYMRIIEARARTRRNGAIWQLRALDVLESEGSFAPDSPGREAALAQVLASYLEQQATAQPVHEWQLPA